MHRGWIIALLALLGVGLGVAWWRHSRLEHRYDSLIQAAARQHGLPADLVKAVVWRESKFDASARGSHGEFGLMQVTENAAQEWADARKDRSFHHECTLNPMTNLQAGCYYLSKISRRYLATDQPAAFALADYNAGRGNVLRWMKGPSSTNAAAFLETMTFPGTRDYVVAILGRRRQYRDEFR